MAAGVFSTGRRLGCTIAAGLLLASSAAAQDPAPGATPPPLQGAWIGSYVCSQGLTGLTLTINAQDGHDFTGYFHFYPPVSNPQAREGCFAVKGRIDSQRRVSVQATRWITQPDGYVTVDLAGALDQTGAGLAGRVVGPPPIEELCTTFTLDVRRPGPKISPLCHAGVAALPGR